MPKSRRPWKEDDLAKLQAMAGKELGERIAAELGRSYAALAVKASELGLSLRTKPRGGRGKRRMAPEQSLTLIPENKTMSNREGSSGPRE